MVATRQALERSLFTVESANAMLPLVRAIVRDLVELAREVMERRHRLTTIMVGRTASSTPDPYSEELEQIQADLDRNAERLRGYVEELRQLGVEPKSVAEGLVDFPSVIDGRLVYLCWRLGEPRVEYWHELDAGFQGRQPLPGCNCLNRS